MITMREPTPTPILASGVLNRLIALRAHEPVRVALVLLIAGTFLAILAPFNTSYFGWPTLWFYWVGVIVGGGFCVWASEQAIIAAIGRARLEATAPLSRFGVAIVAAFPITALVLTVNTSLGLSMPPRLWPMLYGYVLVIGLAMAGIGALLDRAQQARSSAPPAGTPEIETPPERPTAERLRERLPHRLRAARILALQAEDHYLRVHTDAGDALILMRLADAVDELDGADGMRVHRSWWVARDAVIAVERGNGRMRLTLTAGVEAPVSRTYAPKVREAGWV